MLEFFKKIYTKVVAVVIILLILILGNSILGIFIPNDETSNIFPEKLEPDQQMMVEDSGQMLDYDQNENQLIDGELMDDESAEDASLGDKPENQASSIFYSAQVDDSNAFELLKENAEIEYKEYDFGVFVESINGVAADSTHFWAFYLNGEQSMTGADQTVLNTGDQVEWRYEEFK